MKVIIRHEAELAALLQHQPAFTGIAGLNIASSDFRHWTCEGRDIQIMHVAIIGKSGYGKSSLVNALIGHDVMKTSAIEACTREAQNAMFRIRDGQYLAFADVPGIGESAQCDEKYLSMYQDLVRKSDVVVHMLRADCRDYAIDEAAFARLFPDRASRRKVILAVNGCDKIEPLSRQTVRGPSDRQWANVQEKIRELGPRFAGVKHIIPCCANPAWRLEHLSEAITVMLEEAARVTLAVAA